MYNKEIKIGLISLLTIFAIYLFFQGSIGWGIILILLAGLVVLSIFKNENIMVAFYHLRKGNFEKAEKALNGVSHPEKLVKSQESYFHYLNGLIAMQKPGGFKKAKDSFRKSLSAGLRMKQDQAVAKLNLAGIYLHERRKREATALIQEVKKLDTNKLLTEQVKMIEFNLKRI